MVNDFHVFKIINIPTPLKIINHLTTSIRFSFFRKLMFVRFLHFYERHNFHFIIPTLPFIQIFVCI